MNAPPAATKAGLAWRENAACRDKPKGLFFPGSGPGSHRAAAAVCEGCPVRKECLEYALAFYPDLPMGVWGGLSQTELKTAASARRRRAS